MADNQETPENSREYTQPDRASVAVRLDALEEWQRGHRAKLDELTAEAERQRNTLAHVEIQGLALGEQLGDTQAVLSEVRDAVRPAPERDRDPLSAAGMLAEVLDHVREAAPLLQSRAVRAMRAGGSVLDYLKAGRS